jgi:hypothetical protein
MPIVIVEKIQTGFMNIKSGTVKDISWQSCGIFFLGGVM